MYITCITPVHYYFSKDITRYHILIKTNIKMLENYDVHHYSAFWKKEEEFLELEWDMNDLCTLIRLTVVKLHFY